MAEAIPRSGSNDRRVRIATYQGGQVYRLSVSLTLNRPGFPRE